MKKSIKDNLLYYLVSYVVFVLVMLLVLGYTIFDALVDAIFWTGLVIIISIPLIFIHKLQDKMNKSILIERK